MDEISEFLLLIMTDGGHFGFYALENSARPFKRGLGTVKRYLQKVGHRIMVLDPTSLQLNEMITQTNFGDILMICCTVRVVIACKYFI